MITIKKNPIEETHEIVCERCGAVLEYTDNDTIMFPNEYKEFLKGIVCPCCGYEIVIEALPKSKDEPKFPIDFYHFGEGEKACILTKEEVQHYVDKVYANLKNSTEESDFTYTGTGDTMVFGHKYMEDDNTPSFSIFVAKNYWEYDE